MSTSFFDSISLAAMDEINVSLSRRDSDHYDSPLSLKGRACCLMRTVSHALGIGLKPLYYLGFYVLSRQSIAFIRYIPREQLENDIRLREHADELRLIRSLIDNPELVERVKRELSGMPLCALVAPFSQTLQVLKSALGIIHPGLYYQHDPFLSIFAQLTITAKDVGCSPELISELERGSVIIHDSLQNNMANRDFYYEIFLRDFSFISTKFSETLTKPIAGGTTVTEDVIPKNRKLALLNILDPRGTKSGINGCAPALGRLLQHICSHLTVPEDPYDAIIHLCNLFKSEVIDRMVMISEATNHEACKAAGKCDHVWENLVNSMAHDPSHRANAFIVALGANHLYLSPDIVERARKDCMAERITPLTRDQEQPVVQAFYSYFYTESELKLSLLQQINSQPDGSPGLKLLRDKMFQLLAEKMQAEAGDHRGDTTMEAVQLYYLHQGQGNPSEMKFTDLNEVALDCFVRTKWFDGVMEVRQIMKS